jgi:uncharacterized protein YPO0396
MKVKHSHKKRNGQPGADNPGTMKERKTKMTTAERYQAALKKIGGAAGLMNLPDQVKEVLKSTTDLQIKTEMLEMIAGAIEK